MKIEQPLCKNSQRNNATKQYEPHQRPPLLHVVDHRRLINEQSAGCKTNPEPRATRRQKAEGRRQDSGLQTTPREPRTVSCKLRAVNCEPPANGERRTANREPRTMTSSTRTSTTVNPEPRPPTPRIPTSDPRIPTSNPDPKGGACGVHYQTFAKATALL